MATIRIWSGQAALDDHLAGELAAGEASLVGRSGARDETWDGFWARLAPSPVRELDAITARLALRAACARVDVGPFARVAGSRGFLSGVAHFIADVEAAGLTAAEIGRGVATVEGAAGERLRVLARILGETERTVDAAGVSAERRRGAVVRSLRHASGMPVVVDDVEILPRNGWTPADVELVVALARRSAGRVLVHLSWGAGRPETFAGVDAVLAGFEAKSELGNLELVLSDPVSRRAPALSLLAAPTPESELRALAAHARELVDEGAPPEGVAVVARSPGAIAAGLADELERVGLGLEDRRGSTLVATPVARLALALTELGLPGRGFPREDTLAVLGSRYVDGAEESHIAARRARELGLRDLGGTAGARLADPAIAKRLARIAAWPASGTLADHACSLAALLVDLGIGLRARGFDAQPEFSEIDRALARDQASMSALEDLLAALPAAAEASGFAASRHRRLQRADFGVLLADLMAEITLAPRGGRGGAVRLVGLEELAGRRFEHVLVARLVDGMAPARATDDGVYGEGERWALNRALGRRVVPDGAGGERTPFERLMLEEALASASASVLLSYPTTIGDRPAPRSSFVDEIARTGVPIALLPGSPIPSLARVVAPDDVVARVALEAWADPAGRVPPAPRLEMGQLVDIVAGARPERLRRVRELAAIERRRWQAGTAGEAGDLCGDVSGLAARVGGSAEVPVSARQLEMMANCGWSFFAARVLGVAANEEGSDSPSARSAGLLAHRCLEHFYRERAAAGRLPLVADHTDRQALEAACTAVYADTEIVGHAGLWELGREKLLDSLWRWVENEAANGAPGGGVPARFELAFGAGHALPALAFATADGGRFHVGGRIDRLDRVDGGAVVIDYKLGSQASQRAKLKEEHHLQLPLYAAAVRAAPGWGGRVDAAFVSIKDATSTKTLRAVLGDAETEELLANGLPAKVSELANAARAGAFTLHPVDCRNCAFRTACRVVALAGEDES